MESMDAQMDMRQHYDVDANERPIALKASLSPFSMGDIKPCATCRGPLRDIARYGRLVRRALLDESTKKLILFLNREYVPFATELPRLIQELQETPKRTSHEWPRSIKIAGARQKQADSMRSVMHKVYPNRWEAILNLRKRIEEYHDRVMPEEQPFQRVSDMVETARRRNKTTSHFEVHHDVLQTKGALQARALGLRLHVALLVDFVSLAELARSRGIELQLDLRQVGKECEQLVHDAAESHRPSQQVEGFIFHVQLLALERAHPSSLGARDEHLERAHALVAKARDLCNGFLGQTQGLSEEIENAERMLNGGTFYTAVTSEERMTVITAMAREFRGTGHWYYCPNMHPFTIGECGGAMQTASCPECGALVGGQGHQTVEGVTSADDLENDLRRIHL